MSLYTIPEGINIEATAQRTDIAHFMDVAGVEMGSTTIADDTYQQLGTGFTSLTESPSAQTMGDDFVSGFNAAMTSLEAAFAAEQAKITAEYTSGNGKAVPTTETTAKTDRIVIENHVNAQLNVDGRKMAETTMQYEKQINRERGK